MALFFERYFVSVHNIGWTGKLQRDPKFFGSKVEMVSDPIFDYGMRAPDPLQGSEGRAILVQCDPNGPVGLVVA